MCASEGRPDRIRGQLQATNEPSPDQLMCAGAQIAWEIRHALFEVTNTWSMHMHSHIVLRLTPTLSIHRHAFAHPGHWLHHLRWRRKQHHAGKDGLIAPQAKSPSRQCFA